MQLRLNRTTIIMIAFMIIGGYFLWTEHSAHIALAVPYLPFLLLLACPILHFFMHGKHGHGGHGHHNEAGDSHEGDHGTSDATKLKSASTDVPNKNKIPNTGGHHD